MRNFSSSFYYLLSFRSRTRHTHLPMAPFLGVIRTYRKEIAVRKGFSAIFKDEIMVDRGVIYIRRWNMG